MSVCAMAGILAECLSADESALCRPCTELEIGESVQNLTVRCAKGWTRNRYEKWLGEEQARVDEKSARTAKGRSRFE